MSRIKLPVFSMSIKRGMEVRLSKACTWGFSRRERKTSGIQGINNTALWSTRRHLWHASFFLFGHIAESVVYFLKLWKKDCQMCRFGKFPSWSLLFELENGDTNYRLRQTWRLADRDDQFTSRHLLTANSASSNFSLGAVSACHWLSDTKTNGVMLVNTGW